VLSQISSLVTQGMSAVEIADKIGCSLGTLRVKCSQHGISLRRCCDKSGAKLEAKPHTRIVIQLPHGAAIQLNQQAQNHGTTGPRLAAALLEAVVQDNLYDAVIDREIVRELEPPDAAAGLSGIEDSDVSRKRRTRF
jgi:hypothetical protein